MGDAPDNSFVPFLLNDGIWQYINELSCSNETIELGASNLSVHPNPANGSFVLSCDVPFQISVSNALGQEVMNTRISPGETNFTLEESGLYFLQSTDQNGQKSIQRLIIH
jgi:hypothetical protein